MIVFIFQLLICYQRRFPKVLGSVELFQNKMGYIRPANSSGLNAGDVRQHAVFNGHWTIGERSGSNDDPFHRTVAKWSFASACCRTCNPIPRVAPMNSNFI